MATDGAPAEVSDEPASAEAHLGLGLGTGTDVAVEASDPTLVRGDLRAAADAIRAEHGLAGPAGLAGAVWHDVEARDVRVGLVSPGLVAAGAALAAAVRFVVTFPGVGCPTEVVLSPPVEG